MSGRIGVTGYSASARLPIRRGLVECINRTNPVPLTRTDLQPTAGAARSRRGGYAKKHSDEVVLEVRRLYEQERIKTGGIVAILTSKGVSITAGDVGRYIDYQSRGALVPEPNASPYL